MRHWHAIVPLKSGPARKSRLNLPVAERHQLTQRMAAHVIDILGQVPDIACVNVLAPEPWPGTAWIADRDRGLNAELIEARRALLDRPVLIIHADLPELCRMEVERLIAGTDDARAALAPDRHGTGTNAIALPAEMEIDFAFGPASFQAHRAMAREATIVCAPGLANDIDLPQDLAASRLAGGAVKVRWQRSLESG